MTRIVLSEEQIPTAWFNVLPVMPEPLQPPLHPATREPVGPDDLAPLFPMGLIAQEVSSDQWIDIPGEVLDILRMWRPTPLVRATRRGSGTFCPPMPSHPRRMRPSLMRAPATNFAVSIGIAKHRPCAGRMTAVLTPITSPRAVTSGPPEFPGLSAASV